MICNYKELATCYVGENLNVNYNITSTFFGKLWNGIAINRWEVKKRYRVQW